MSRGCSRTVVLKISQQLWSWGRLHKVKTVPTPAWRGKGLTIPPLWLESYWQLMIFEESVSFKGGTVGQAVSSGCPTCMSAQQNRLVLKGKRRERGKEHKMRGVEKLGWIWSKYIVHLYDILKDLIKIQFEKEEPLILECFPVTYVGVSNWLLKATWSRDERRSL